MVKRVLPDGTIDRGFGRRGAAMLPGRAARFPVAGQAIDASGRLLLAGTSGHSFFLTRFTSNGRLDRAFGDTGRLATSFGASSVVNARSVAINSRGRAVVAGTIASPRIPRANGLALARFLLGR